MSVDLKLPPGEPIAVEGTRPVVPARPIIPFVVGDGVGIDITPAMRKVLDAAVEQAYGGERRLMWMEVPAGEKAHEKTGQLLPEEAVAALQQLRVGIIGPLTPGGADHPMAVLRRRLGLFANLRPVRHIPSWPSPVKRPDRVELVFVRDATEDLYAGLEWPAGSPEARRLLSLAHELGAEVADVDHTAVAVKPISQEATRRLVRLAIQYAIDRQLDSVTLVHQGEVMASTEGAFRDWGYRLAADEFGDRVVTEAEVRQKHRGRVPEGLIVLRDRLAGAMLQNLLTHPSEYDLLVLPRQQGDLLSRAALAQVGGMSVGHGAYLGAEAALFGVIHGPDPRIAGLDRANPTALILAGAMMLEYLGWEEAARRIVDAISLTVADNIVTFDLSQQLPGTFEVSCSAFTNRVVERL